jgi:hypothetical protein
MADTTAALTSPSSAPARLADGLAFGLSGACLVHCLSVPLVVTAAPAVANSLLTQSWVHPALLALAAPAAVWARAEGGRRHGRWGLPALLAAIGIFVMLVGAAPDMWHDGIETLALHDAWHAAEQPLTVIGVLVLSAGHVVNWRRTRAAAPHCAAHGHVHHRH